jgi:hypothetical protein
MQEIKQEKTQIKQKILLYLRNKGVSPYEFYKITGVTRGILTQPNGISEENLARFLAYAPDVSPSWLLTGEGEMLKTNGITTDTLPEVGSCQPFESVVKGNDFSANTQEKTENNKQDFSTLATPQFSELISTITQQAEEIGRLKARIAELERRRGDNAPDAQSGNVAHAG